MLTIRANFKRPNTQSIFIYLFFKGLFHSVHPSRQLKGTNKSQELRKESLHYHQETHGLVPDFLVTHPTDHSPTAATWYYSGDKTVGVRARQLHRSSRLLYKNVN